MPGQRCSGSVSRDGKGIGGVTVYTFVHTHAGMLFLQLEVRTEELVKQCIRFFSTP